MPGLDQDNLWRASVGVNCSAVLSDVWMLIQSAKGDTLTLIAQGQTVGNSIALEPSNEWPMILP